MSQYDNRDSFVLFKNDKGDNPNRPDYTGTITLEDGTEKRLAAWIKEGKKGKFMAGKVSEKQPSQQQSQPQAAAEAPADDSDPIPF
jgi:hypothetical protein